MNRLKKGTAIAAMAATLVGGFEGLRTVAYPDPATKGPPWTVCYGHTMWDPPWRIVITVLHLTGS